ncbi:fatty-acyl-CoA synthase [Streptomyces sp. yr375]|uniref:class I adenylate-forming enzyme family protein n=1 Tax=Streptomyces sp. yr375 TaxID=1761906 RepID=UPI0008B6D840|nr:AMP-binding protein [Streptomyces sp. yr375]SES46726.1 fatty-acyl-CoA synthase [Streptomyces sp. yr375]
MASHDGTAGPADDPLTALRRLAADAAGAVAVRYDGRSLSYADLLASVRRLAGALAACGVRAGDRIAYAGRNSPLLLETMYAAHWLGAAFVPLNFRSSPHEALAVLEDCAPAAVVAEASSPLLDTGLGDGPGLVDRPVLGDRPVLVDGRPPAPAPPEAPAPPVCAGDDDLAVLLYTSGSTGRARGVILTHGNLRSNNRNVRQALGLGARDTVLGAAPLFHVGGLCALTLPVLTYGGTLLVHRAFDPAAALADLVTHRVTALFMVPTMYQELLVHLDTADTPLPHLRLPVVAGAPVPRQLVTAYARHGILLQQAWGLTETTSFVTCLPRNETLLHAGSAGPVMPFTRVRVTALDGSEPLLPGRRGELWVRGAQVTPGYWKDPQHTAQHLGPDGWLRTGDVGFLDADGRVHVVDRRKDMVITGGENVSPAEVEQVLGQCPAVRDIAVFGIPHARWGETVAAAVRPARGQTVSAASLRAYADGLLARYKQPTVVHIVDEIPRTATGKTDKPALRERFGTAGLT